MVESAEMVEFAVDVVVKKEVDDSENSCVRSRSAFASVPPFSALKKTSSRIKSNISSTMEETSLSILLLAVSRFSW